MKRGDKVAFTTDSTDTTVRAVDKIKEGLEDVRAGRIRTTIASEIEDGDVCPECFLDMVELRPNGSCTCFATPRPPCSACEDSILVCPNCGWRQ